MTNPTQPDPLEAWHLADELDNLKLSKYGEIKRSLTDFHIALESLRQRQIIERALAALGSGRQDKAREIIRELSEPERNLP